MTGRGFVGRISILGELEQMVLMAVVRLDDAYPVSVRNEIARLTGVDLSRGTIYVTLHRLEQKGLVESALGEATAARGGKPKRGFNVTPAGATALRNAREALASLSKGLEIRLKKIQ